MPTTTSSPSVAILGTRGYPSYYGGFETLVRKLAPYLADQGYAVTVYGRAEPATRTAPCGEVDPRVRRVRTRGVATKSLSTLTHGLTSAWHAAGRHDVVLVMNVANGVWLPLLRRGGARVALNVDGIEWEREKWGTAAKLTFKLGAAASARWADVLVYDAVEIGRRWRSEFGRDGVYIPYGGDPCRASPPPPGLESGRYVLVVARLVPENTVLPFLEAAEAIASACPVVIVGSSGHGGPLEERVRTLARVTPNVSWLGHVRDDEKLFQLWRHAGVYFHGHSVGGTNPALVQAMHCGAPTVARDTPYTREVLGDAAVYTGPDPGSIASSVLGLLRDDRRRRQLGSAARARAEERYRWELVCEDYARLVKELLAAPSRSTRWSVRRHADQR